MTGRRRTRSTFLPALSRPVRALRAAAALVACASLAVGCGAVPGFTGGAGDDPITVMTWAPQDTNATNKPGMPALALAYARQVNEDGGINGRELKVIICNDRNDGVHAAKCARRAVKEKVVAVVGSYSQFADSFFPILEGAGIPYIGGYGITNAEFTSPLSYPVNGGQPALLAGLGRQLASDCGPVALVRPDTIAGDELPNLLNSGLETGGHRDVADVRAAEDATEFSTQSEQALTRATSDPAETGCVVPALGDRTNTFMDSFRRARKDYPEVRLGTVLGSVDQTVIDFTGGASSPYEGAYITGWYPVETDKRWDPMKKVIREQAFTDNRIDPADAGVQTTWIAYTVLEAVVKALGDDEVSSDTVRRTLDDGFRVTTGGLTPTLRWQFQDVLASVGFPRLVNTDVTVQVVRDGQLVAARRGALDVTKTLQGTERQG
ncbi:ABC transporter substrate-binding protein [Streptomyces sp. TRM72054]|uniref:ABC transporter substrate-binding protein n=1 Tax=Streptomyces sp. TRM72054 TaxID=2870562 RepID=UPI001C8BBFA2|nr:ABC transporter substrate-binding protein [Streptomyces sp. TRM72054]MBX9394972.1 ABC transporter substrate-binding protein [Streptomyces sp. TRM72054]